MDASKDTVQSVINERLKQQEIEMKRLTKDQLKRKGELVNRIDDLHSQLNAAIEEAEELRDEIHTAMEEYYDARSEKWQEGETGEDYKEWMDEWETEFETVECDVSSNLDGLSNEFER